MKCYLFLEIIGHQTIEDKFNCIYIHSLNKTETYFQIVIITQYDFWK